MQLDPIAQLFGKQFRSKPNQEGKRTSPAEQIHTKDVNHMAAQTPTR